MINLIKTISWIKKYDNVSIPQYMLELGISYTEAKANFAKLSENDYISSKPNGLYYAVNTGKLFLKTPSEKEIAALVPQLTVSDVELLDRLLEDEKIPASEIEKQDAVMHLRSLGLVFEFCDSYFLSVMPAVAKTLCRSAYEVVSSFTVAYIAYPILVACIEQGVEPYELLDLTLLPRDCKKYIRWHYRKYINEGKKPGKLKTVGEAAEKKADLLRYEIIESLADQCDFATKDEYFLEAAANVSIILNSDVCPPDFKRYAEVALKEIRDELTLSNLREIRNIIHGTGTHPIDDDDDDDDIGICFDGIPDDVFDIDDDDFVVDDDDDDDEDYDDDDDFDDDDDGDE